MRLLLLVSFVALFSTVYGSLQSAAVKGRLLCNGNPLVAHVKVKLYDEDTWSFDDLMAEGVTDADGAFELAGSEAEDGIIEPKLNVYHRCNYNGMCYKKFTIRIPAEFVHEGAKSEKAFDIGDAELSKEHPGENLDCFN